MSTDRPTGFIGASNVPDTISEQRCGQALLTRKPSNKPSSLTTLNPPTRIPLACSFVDVGSGSISSSVGSDGDLFVDGDGEPDDGRGSFGRLLLQVLALLLFLLLLLLWGGVKWRGDVLTNLVPPPLSV